MRAEKQLLLEELREKITGAKAILVARYGNLGANAAAEFRTAVRKTGGDFEVVSKRLLVKAAHSTGLQFEGIDFGGHIGIVIAGPDMIQTAKTVIDFGKEREDVVTVVGGRIDGVTYGAAAVDRLSKLPGIQEMRAQLLGLLEAPMAQTLAVMEALLTSVLHCMENKRQADGEKA